MADAKQLSAETIRQLGLLPIDRKVAVSLELIRRGRSLFALQLLRLAVAELGARQELMEAMPKDRVEREQILAALESCK